MEKLSTANSQYVYCAEIILKKKKKKVTKERETPDVCVVSQTNEIFKSPRFLSVLVSQFKKTLYNSLFYILCYIFYILLSKPVIP